MKLNLGCGADYREGWVNVDHRWPGVPNPPRMDLDLDLNEPWPWPDHSASHILAYNVFEHLDDVMRAMAEAHRVLAPGGTLRIVGPAQGSVNWCADPTHKRAFNPYTFDCWDPETRLGRRAWNFWPKWRVMERKDLVNDLLFILEPRG